MVDKLLPTDEAAQLLGISAAGLYDWLRRSDSGELIIRGQNVTIDYFQGGAKGQGRIKIYHSEVQRLLNLMRVRPHAPKTPRQNAPPDVYPGIYVTLGRPTE